MFKEYAPLSLVDDDEPLNNQSSSQLPKVSKKRRAGKTLSHVPSIVDLKEVSNTIDGKAVQDSLISPPISFMNPIPPVTPLHTTQFLQVVEEVRLAIAQGICPVRISQGSSGSYFCKNRQNEIVAVFKPKNEEPYGHLNPKWTKWIHKNLFPCCFGRSCLIPNLGYISEAAASYIDRRLQLNVVPRTEVVSLSSPTFYYSVKDRKAYRNGVALPPKLGSFQIFLKGFKDATSFFKEGYDHIARQEDSSESLTNPENPLNWTDQIKKEFQLGFERLVVLDYIIRNTDRGSDNWMVNFNNASNSIQIAAIDNGLAFPYKHPDRWRSYPFGWSFLPIARIPFSAETRQQILYLLTSQEWWKETLEGLERLFRLDEDFSESMWKKQKAVLRGQGYNLVEALRRSELGDVEAGSPLGLLKRPVVAVFDDECDETNFIERQRRNLRRVSQRFETFTRNQPCFSWC